jgi:hypothetical protein
MAAFVSDMASQFPAAIRWMFAERAPWFVTGSYLLSIAVGQWWLPARPASCRTTVHAPLLLTTVTVVHNVGLCVLRTGIFGAIERTARVHYEQRGVVDYVFVHPYVDVQTLTSTFRCSDSTAYSTGNESKRPTGAGTDGTLVPPLRA